MREREREREREHTSILYNSMWVIIYNRASMWVVNAIQKQTLHKKKEGWKNNTLLSSTIFSF